MPVRCVWVGGRNPHAHELDTRDRLRGLRLYQVLRNPGGATRLLWISILACCFILNGIDAQVASKAVHSTRGAPRGLDLGGQFRHPIKRRGLSESRIVPHPPEYVSPVTHAVSPRIFIYDLPKKFTENCFWIFGCEKLRDRIRGSRYHTTDGDNADYYLIPHKEPITEDLIIEMFDYIRHTWPFFNATKAKRQARHMMILECEHGPSDCSFEGPIRMNKPGSKLPDDINPANPERNVMFLTLNGVQDGMHREACLDCFQRGKDIQLVTHNNHLCGPLCGFTLERLRELSPFSRIDANGDTLPHARVPDYSTRNITLFFSGQAGWRRVDDPSGRYPLLAYHRDRPGWAVFDTFEPPPEVARERPPHEKVDYAAYMSSSVFCASPLGKYGGDPDRYLPAILLGCIPVVFGSTRHVAMANPLEEHPEILWESFSVQVHNEDIEHLDEILAAITPERLSQMRTALKEVWPRFLYTSIYGTYLGEDGSRDAFDALMVVMARRLVTRKHTSL